MTNSIRHQVSMARHTAWGIGGVAECVFEPLDLDELVDFLSAGSGCEPLLWVGLGSNLLVRDGGFPGTVILTSRGFGGLEVPPAPGEDPSSSVVRAECGVACAKVARVCARHGVVGSEFLAGIPGTIGGALAMNAGGPRGEIWDFVRSVKTVDRSGRLHERPREDFEISYRRVRMRDEEWFVEAELALDRGIPAVARARIRALLRQRTESQPTGQRSCGSVFKNPPGDHAGRLVDEAGLKGARSGGAMVSRKHANFIVSDATATATDVEALINHVRAVVEKKFGVALETEVRIVGRPGPGAVGVMHRNEPRGAR